MPPVSVLVRVSYLNLERSYKTELCGTSSTLIPFGFKALTTCRTPCDVRFSGRPDLTEPLSNKLQRVSDLLLRKEVIQPQVPLRLPCYDFIPITDHTLGGNRLRVQ